MYPKAPGVLLGAGNAVRLPLNLDGLLIAQPGDLGKVRVLHRWVRGPVGLTVGIQEPTVEAKKVDAAVPVVIQRVCQKVGHILGIDRVLLIQVADELLPEQRG